MAEFCAVCLRRYSGTGECACPPGTRSRAPSPARVAPLPPAPPGPVPAQLDLLDLRHRTRRRVLAMAAAALVVVGTAVTAVVLAGRPAGGPTSGVPLADASVDVPPAGFPPAGGLTTDPAAGGDVGYPADRAPVPVTAAAASCTAGPGVDSAGNPFTYEPANAVDGRPDTAWRCDHDGAGESLLLTFAQPAVLTWAGMVPGFAKTDPYDGTDRYLQGRRVSAARFVFDDGTYVEHAFDVRATDRSMQFVTFPAHRTGHVRVIVLASTPGTPTNGQAATDKVAISELAAGR